MLAQCSAIDEQLRRLQGESCVGDIEDLKVALEKKSALENALKVRVLENVAQREVSIMCFIYVALVDV